MEDVENFTRLKYEQERVLKSNEDARKIRDKLKADYLKLQTRLQTLPDTISEDVMVPIGKVAFFPGHIIHTNEIMVLLGDNWFVERSAKQAIEIVERRIKLVEKQLGDFEKEESNISAQKSYTDEFHRINQEVGGIKEIQEELLDDSLPSKKGRQRKAHVAKHDSVPRSVKFKENGDLVRDIPHDMTRSISDTIDHDELFARLNELEKEEQEEEDRLHEENIKEILNGKYTPNSRKEATTKDDMETNRRHVKFKNDSKGSSSFSYDSDDNEPETSGNIIQFTHTPQLPHRERSASESDLRNAINTPADLFDHFSSKASKSFEEVGEKPLKSILKKDSRSNSNENLKLRPILKTSPEHQPGTPEQVSFDDPRPILKTPPDSQGSERRPGTPEYMLNDDPKPILKTNGPIYQTVGTSDSDGNERRPILKSMDPHVDDMIDVSCENDGDDTRPILKAFNNETSRHNKSTSEVSGRKTILKNTSNEGASDRMDRGIEDRVVERSPGTGIADRIMERQNHVVVDTSVPETTSNRRPVSRFKASRSAK